MVGKELKCWNAIFSYAIKTGPTVTHSAYVKVLHSRLTCGLLRTVELLFLTVAEVRGLGVEGGRGIGVARPGELYGLGGSS